MSEQTSAPEAVGDAPAPADNAGEQGHGASAAITYEDVASAMGWKPEGEFKGPPEKWTDAKSFLENQKGLAQRARTAEEAAKRTIRMSEKLVKEAKEKAIRDAEAKIREATANGDAEGAVEAVRELQRATDTGPRDRFKAENPWFEVDEDATAIALAAAHVANQAGKSADEQLEAAKKAVKRAMPELFEGQDDPEPKRKPPPAVASGDRTASPSNRKKGLADVPASVRAQWTPKFLRLFETTPEKMADAYWKENA